jgi:hypothetical protein
MHGGGLGRKTRHLSFQRKAKARWFRQPPDGAPRPQGEATGDASSGSRWSSFPRPRLRPRYLRLLRHRPRTDGPNSGASVGRTHVPSVGFSAVVVPIGLPIRPIGVFRRYRTVWLVSFCARRTDVLSLGGAGGRFQHQPAFQTLVNSVSGGDRPGDRHRLTSRLQRSTGLQALRLRPGA